MVVDLADSRGCWKGSAEGGGICTDEVMSGLITLCPVAVFLRTLRLK